MSALAARRVPAADSDVDRVAMPGRGDRTDDACDGSPTPARARTSSESDAPAAWFNLLRSTGQSTSPRRFMLLS